MRYSDADLQEELHRLADELGHPPTLQDVRDDGEYAAMTYYNRFGSWRESLAAAGYEPREPDSRVPTVDLLTELERVADEHGAPPSASDMDDYGEYWASTYRRRFGSWNRAVKAAGFDPTAASTEIPKAELLDEIRRLADELGKRPTFREMTDQGNYGTETYIRRFGSWSEAVDAALDS